MTSPSETQVLIVGAGPNGLVCAITLAGLGVKVTIVDALPARGSGARGALVHARTLEVLKTIGLSSALTELGIPSKGVVFHGGTEKLLNVDVSALHGFTEFPFVLLAAQYDVERVLEEHLLTLGVQVIRNSNVTGLCGGLEGTGARVTFEDGSTISASYVIGADGSRSTIRTLSGIGFKDPFTRVPYDDKPAASSVIHICLADIYLEDSLPKPIPRDHVSWHLNGKLMFCPLFHPSGGDAKLAHTTFWRIAIFIPIGSTSIPPRHPDIDYLQREMNARKPWPEKITIVALSTAATYRVRSAVADNFFKKMGDAKVLLVGDAAHVHSPTGGQGMNLGICDAVALGRAVHTHITQQEISPDDPKADQVLENYAVTRRHTAVQVISTTERLTAIIGVVGGWQQMVRNFALGIAGRLPFIRKKIAWRIAGLGYRDN